MRQQNDIVGRRWQFFLQSAPHYSLLEAWCNWLTDLDQKGEWSSSGPATDQLTRCSVWDV